MNKKRWIYDLEIYPNLFLLCAKHTITQQLVKYVVSPYHDDRIQLIKWLQNDVEEMVGFNNISYDYPLFHNSISKLWNLRGKVFCKKNFIFSSSLIKGKKIYIKEKNYLKKQIDLFKINHYDNKARVTSLKLLEFNLRLNNIKELPFPPEKILDKEEINIIIDYCNNDVEATYIFYKETLSEIKLREKIKFSI